ncbi:hypothetical protein [Enterococcus thailandicus]|uniref:hypothetical protein n=1 Tax=Enterococcus thailandicus TaxID=417368 RepID=UPI0035DF09BC
MNEDELEVKFISFCKTANKVMYQLLLNGLIEMKADVAKIDYLKENYCQRFGQTMTQKELTPSANEVSQ